MSGKNGRETPEELRRIGIFSGLPDADLEAIWGKLARRTYPAGDPLFREGEAGDELFVLLSGEVSISVRSADEDIVLARLGPGSFFGEMAIIERAPRSATCAAIGECRVLAFNARDFDALLGENPGAATGILDRMLRISAERLMKTGSFLSQMVQWGDAARKRAITDPATGLFNRRYLEDTLELLLGQGRQEGRTVSFGMFDLDHFGALNREHGAAFCDALILRVADAMRAAFTDDDILVRYGGDEFCFVIPGDAASALERCEAVCAALRDLRFEGKDGLRITCSIGLASFPADASNGQQLRERADKALYRAKEGGRDQVRTWTGSGELKREIPTIAKKRGIVANIGRALAERDDFLIIGHKDPDEDCISAMVAFALLVSKFNKKASISIGSSNLENFEYLLSICRYNSIVVRRDGNLPPCSTLVLVDTAKPDMIDRGELYAGLRADPAVLKIEIDHHLKADSRYFGDPGYRLVTAASSSCEILGYLCLKLERDKAFMHAHQIDELLTRNLVLAILSGILGDTQMGKYLVTHRERFFYQHFSSLFETLLAKKTRKNSGNFSSKEQVFQTLISLSGEEEACFNFFVDGATRDPGLWHSISDEAQSADIFSRFGVETLVTVSKNAANRLAEGSGKLGLVGYYDDPSVSDFVQFRLRRAGDFTNLDLRGVLVKLGIENGGGHPGAIGFRVERSGIGDFTAFARDLCLRIEDILKES